jgi:sec-independent protein translocase protein TatA
LYNGLSSTLPIAQFGPLQGPEILILIIVAVILIFGAKKIPELARGIGRASGEFKKGKEDINKEIEDIQKGNDKDNLPGREADALIKAAKELGIETDGKTEKELRKDIENAIKEK